MRYPSLLIAAFVMLLGGSVSHATDWVITEPGGANTSFAAGSAVMANGTFNDDQSSTAKVRIQVKLGGVWQVHLGYDWVTASTIMGHTWQHTFTGLAPNLYRVQLGDAVGNVKETGGEFRINPPGPPGP